MACSKAEEDPYLCQPCSIERTALNIDTKHPVIITGRYIRDLRPKLDLYAMSSCSIPIEYKYPTKI